MPRLLAGLATSAVSALALGVAVLGSQPPSLGSLPDLVAPAGHAEYLGGSGRLVVETGQYPGYFSLFGAPLAFWNVADAVMAATEDGATSAVERMSGARTAERLLVPTDAGLVTFAETWGGISLSYPEGRLDLPANLPTGLPSSLPSSLPTTTPSTSPAPSTWSHSGPVTASLGEASVDTTYTLTAEATPEPGGCTRLAYLQRTAVLDEHIERAWQEVRCPARGITEFHDDGLTWSATSPAPLPPLSIADDDAHPVPPVASPDPTSPDPSSPGPTSPTPVVTAHALPIEFPAVSLVAPFDSGRLDFVASVVTANNVVGARFAEGAAEVAWTAHPGGLVLGLGVFGEVVVATTSGKDVVAYDARGSRLWTHRTTELCVTAPVRVEGSAVAVSCLDGSVSALDLQSGELRWTHHLPVEIRLDPVVSEDTFVAADTSGAVLAVREGEVVWRQEFDAEVTSLVPVDGGVALTHVAGRALILLDAQDGSEERLAAPLTSRAITVDGHALAAGPQGVAGGSTTLRRGDAGVAATFRDGTLLATGREIVWVSGTSAEVIHRLPATTAPTFEPRWAVTGSAALLVGDAHTIWVVQ